jgi:peptide/nickel transport system permease protein
MFPYILRRLSWTVASIAFVVLLTFAVFFLLPSGDVASRFAGKAPTPEVIAEIRERLHLSDPWWQQFATFASNFVKGDAEGWPGLGYSYAGGVSVLSEITARAPRTIVLVIGASVLWLVVGVSVGIVSAMWPRSLVDRGVMVLALVGISTPVFWLGLMALWLFSRTLGWTGGTGYTPLAEGFGAWLSHLILPWCVLAFLYAGYYARMTRNSLLETLNEDYIRTARAKGLSETRIMLKHALRMSATLIATMYGMDVALLIGGAVITESVFNIQGLGWLAVESALNQDLPVVVGVVLVTASAVAIMNMLVDILYALIDPRVAL